MLQALTTKRKGCALVVASFFFISETHNPEAERTGFYKLYQIHFWKDRNLY